MNRLNIFLIFFLAFGLMAPYAWAGTTAQQELSPAQFFGYTTPNPTTVNHEAIGAHIAANGAGSNYGALSPARFFGYVEHRPAAIENFRIAPPAAVRGQTETAATRSTFSPGAFFYGYSTPGAQAVCESC